MAQRLYSSTFLETKVARRVLVLFVLCAVLPIVVLGVVSYVQVTNQLNEQAEARLHDASRSFGMAVLGRLLFAEAELEVLAEEPLAVERPRHLTLGTVGPALRPRYLGMAVERSTGRELLSGAVPALEELTAEERDHVAGGGTLIRVVRSGAAGPTIVMGRPQEQAEGAMLWAVLDPAYVWQPDQYVADASLPVPCVLAPGDVPMFCRSEAVDALRGGLSALGRERRAEFEWEGGGSSYLSSAWPIFLAGRFAAPSWTVVMSESKEDVLQPLADFRRSFPLVLLLALLVVALVSNLQIRRSMEPLEALRHGAQQIAQGEFDTRVDVRSDDEFEELAETFNGMVRRLERQFSALRVSNELDRAVLSAIQTEEVAATVLDRAPDLVDADAVALTLFDSRGVGHGSMYSRRDGRPALEAVRISHDEILELSTHRESLVVRPGERGHAYLPDEGTSAPTWEVFPIYMADELGGILALGRDTGMLDADGRMHARQIADQAGVALANASLVEELNELSWGALRALARAIDAKSPWTAGHSERVARLSIAMGKRLGLPDSELETIRRGAMLHDIGKIGVPLEVLDKAGRLTGAEREAMEQHVYIGARILEPVAQFAPVIPIVLHHHERSDGSGYPAALRGEEIPFQARIVAVADVFDALTSKRPYRSGLAREEALSQILEVADRKFDARVVDAFAAVIREDRSVTEGDPLELMS